MKKVFLSVLAVAASCSLMAVNVEPHYGVEFGYDHQGGHYVYAGLDFDQDLLSYAIMDGFHLGGNVQLDFMQGKHRPCLLLGLNYQFLGTSSWGSENTFKKNKQEFEKMVEENGGTNAKYKNYTSMHTLQIPIRAQYECNFNSDWRLFVYTGPQVKIRMSLLQTGTSTYSIDGKKYGSSGKCDHISGKRNVSEWNAGKEDTNKTKLDKDYRYRCFDMSWGFGIGFGWKAFSFAFSGDVGMINVLPSEYRSNALLGFDVISLTLGYRLK